MQSDKPVPASAGMQNFRASRSEGGDSAKWHHSRHIRLELISQPPSLAKRRGLFSPLCSREGPGVSSKCATRVPDDSIETSQPKYMTNLRLQRKTVAGCKNFFLLLLVIVMPAILAISCSDRQPPPENTSLETQVDSQSIREIPSPATDFPGSYVAQAKQFARDAQYDSAIVYFDKARLLYEGQGDWENYVRSYNQMGKYAWLNWAFDRAKLYLDKALEAGNLRLGENHPAIAENYYLSGLVYTDENDYDRVFTALNKALSIQLKTLGERHLDVAQSYNAIGLYYEKKGQYDQALTYYEKSLAIKIQILGEQDGEVAVSYNNLAIASWQKGDYERAFNFSRKAITVFKEALGEDHVKVGFAYNDLANIYHQKGDYDQALIFFEKALSIQLAALGEQSAHNGVVYLNIGLVHFDKGNYEPAIEFTEKAISNFLNTMGEEGDEVAYCYINLGNSYKEKGNYDQAHVFYDKALSIYNTRYGEEHPTVATIYNSKGIVYQRQGNYQKAGVLFDKALSIGLAILGEHHPDVATSYVHLGDLSYVKGDYDRALASYQQAMRSNVPAFAGNDPYSNPLLKDILSEKELLKTLEQKGRALATRYKYSTQIRDLEAAVSVYEIAIQLIDQMRSGYKAEGSKFTLAGQASAIYGMGIQSALRLYKLTANRPHKETAFIFAEKSKAGILLEALSEAEAKHFAGIPDTLLEQEKQLRIDLTFYDRSLSEEKLKREAADSAQIVFYQNRVFGLKQAYDALLQKLEDAYPDYYQLKYQVRTAPVVEIREKILDENSTLIEYFVGEDSLYIFTISRQRFDITPVPKDSLFEREIFQLRNAITAQNSSQYSSAAYSLYRMLLAPVEEKLATGNLIIIPDGLLSYVPFEALLTEEVTEEENENYSTFPFLIKKHAVSYAYSATLLLETLNRRGGEAKREFFACAPVFPVGIEESSGSAKFFEANRALDSTRSINLAYLPATRAEVLNIENLFIERSGLFKRLFGVSYVVYLENEATEANLKSAKLSSYRYLHFATHGFVNEANPKLSGLIFAPDSASGEDGVLYLPEIYNLGLNADLVVLSACETGLGKISRGEGLIGLSRGFLYAGAANLLVSLWQINDVSTANLMVEFYRNMLDGRGKTAALREAKQTLMSSNPQYANPYYWAPFVLIGR